MPQGMEVFNENGLPVLRIVDRVTKILGSVDVANGNSGSVTVPDIPTNEVFYTFVPNNFDVLQSTISDIAFPTFTISGNVISWTYTTWIPGQTPSRTVNGKLVYGRY